MPTSGQSRNSGSVRTDLKMAKVRSLWAYCSMSTWTNAPTSRARAEDRPEPGEDAVGGGLGVEGVEPGGEARELEREVGPGDRAAVVAVDLGDLGLGGERAGEAAEEVEAGLLVGVGLGLADDGLAEQVGGEREPLAAEPADGRERLGGVSPAMNRRAMWVAANRGKPGEQPAPGESRRRQGDRPAAATRGRGRRPRRGTRPGGGGPPRASASAGMASMNRKSWTLTAGSPSVRSISRSSHQARCQGAGPGRPARTGRGRSPASAPRGPPTGPPCSTWPSPSSTANPPRFPGAGRVKILVKKKKKKKKKKGSAKFSAAAGTSPPSFLRSAGRRRPSSPLRPGDGRVQIRRPRAGEPALTTGAGPWDRIRA